MRKLSIVIGLVFVTSCYALQIIQINQYIKETKAHLTEESLKLQETLDARLPVSSKASVGQVMGRKVTLLHFSYPVFIIGDDPRSRQWLQQHAKQLEQEKAIGFVTNIKTSAQLQGLQKLTQAALLPANVDDLMALFHEEHYPIGFHKEELWQ